MTVTFLQTAVSSANATTYTFSAQNLGTAAADRNIVVCATGQDTGSAAKSISSITVQGITASIAIQNQGNASNTSMTAIAIVNVPTGTTGDVVVTFSEAFANCGISLFHIVGMGSTTPNHTNSTDLDNTAVSVNVNAGGVVIGCGATSSSNPTSTWTNLTEVADISREASTGNHTAAYTVSGSTQSLSCTCDFTAGNDPAVSYASWNDAGGTPAVPSTLPLMGVGL